MIRTEDVSRIQDEVTHTAQKVTVELVDDLDGTAAGDISTVTFSLDGVDYEIDLSEGNASKLRDAVQDFIAAARRTGGRIKRTTAAPSSPRPAANREQTKATRVWARENGYDLAQRGRIPAHVITAYEEAQAEAAMPKVRRSRRKVAESAAD